MELKDIIALQVIIARKHQHREEHVAVAHEDNEQTMLIYKTLACSDKWLEETVSLGIIKTTDRLQWAKACIPQLQQQVTPR